jgi:hypothetical protein
MFSRIRAKACAEQGMHGSADRHGGLGMAGQAAGLGAECY